jgi:N6-adenosine-specific RNA methylase IME4
MTTCPPCRADPCECDAYANACEDAAFGHHFPAPKRYRTIVIDPPWMFDQKWATSGIPQRYAGKTLYRKPRGAVANYALMTLQEIAALPVSEWADNNAHLYVWTTNTFMAEAHELMKGWGFKQKTILTWVKPRLGMGTYYRNNTEHVLFGVKGSLPVLRKDVRTAFYGEQGRHSEKPAAFYDIVESMSPDPRLDVFARKMRFNWDAWGKEAYNVPGLPQVGIST